MKEYIEREAILTAFGHEPEVWCEHDPVEIQERNDWNYYKHCIEAVPAADVAPVRHGRWIHPHWRNSVSAADCSECGAEAQHIEYRGVQKYYKNCPSCGARMDKEANT